MSQTVLAFGTFDPLHEGHRFFLRKASECGERLTVVVSSDAAILLLKKRKHFQSQKERMEAVRQLPFVDEVLLGEDDPRGHALLRQLSFQILALGYDQLPSDEEVLAELGKAEKSDARIVRIPAYQPKRFKSSFFR